MLVLHRVIIEGEKSMIFNNPSDICEFYINKILQEGDCAVDATAGNGHDTLKLSNAVGLDGKVYAFDIQQQAIDSAKGQPYEFDNVEFITDSHSRMDEYVSSPPKLVIFNLGYLPGGDHSLATRSDTTTEAIEKAKELICQGGVIILVIYSGGDTGFDEKESVRNFVKNINHKKFNTLYFDYINRPNNPPSVCVIQKKK